MKGFVLKNRLFKKALNVVLALAMVITLLPLSSVTVHAAAVGGYCGDAAVNDGKNVSWSFDSESKTLTISGTGAMADYTTPSARPWGSYLTTIEKVVIGDGVTSIGDFAFNGCSHLNNIEIPSSVADIGGSAFEGCSELTSIAIPDAVTSINESVFEDCVSLTTIVLPYGLTSIKSNAFYCCSALEYIAIPNGVTSIGQGAFNACSSLTSIVIPSNVTSVEDCAFSNCTSLENVIFLSSTIPSIGTIAFASIHGTGKFHVPEGASTEELSGKGPDIATSAWTIEYYGEGAICGENVKWLYMGNTLIISGTGEMYDFDKGGQPWESHKTDIKNIIIGDGVTSIGRNAFCDYSNIIAISLPSSLTKIREEAFSHCSELAGISLPGNVTTIESSAFSDCFAFTRIEIPSGVTSLGEGAFKTCSKLAIVIIPSGVTVISECAFAECGNLKRISIPSSVTSVGKGAFSGCGELTNFIIAEGNTSYKTSDDHKVILSKDGKTIVSFPTASGNYTVPNGVTAIAGGAFRGCEKLTSVGIPSSVTSIGAEAFYNCYYLTDINIPSGVVSIEKITFFGCFSLSSINIPSGTTSIGDFAFYGCEALTSITIPSSVTSLVSGAFCGCANLSAITFEGSTLPTIGTNAFGGVKAIGTFYVPVTTASEELAKLSGKGVDISADKWTISKYKLSTSASDVQYNSTTGTYSAKTTGIGTVTTYYYVNDAWTTTKPAANGTYNVGFSIASNDTHAAFGSASDVKTETPVKTYTIGHTHTFATDWTKDANYHWHAATCTHTTEVSDKAAHSYGAWSSNNDATTTADGTKSRTCSVCGYVQTVTDEGSKREPGSGTVTIPSGKQDENFASGGIESSSKDIKNAVLTEEDKAAIAAGKDVSVWIEMKDQSATISAADKTAVAKKLPNKYQVGIYLDINLWKQTTGSDAVKVTELPNGKIKIGFTIPESLRKEGRIFKLVRIHNGEATVLDVTVDANNFASCETDMFSTYALIYKDADASNIDDNEDDVIDSPEAGDANNAGLWIALMLAGAGVMGFTMICGKKRRSARR